MLRISTSRRNAGCDGTSRRDFLKVGTLGFAGLTLTDLLRARAATGASAKSTSVVWLWLGGGPTQVETFDPKPEAPVEFRSTVGSTKTVLPGVEFGGVFPRMARIADKLAIVRSFAHTNSGHGGGTHWVMTGQDFPPADNGQPQSQPGFGSILARHRGTTDQRSGLPTYVRIGSILGDGPAWLGSAYSPFDSSGDARNNLDLRVNMERLSERRSLLRTFDTLDRSLDRTGSARGLDTIEAQAFDVILSRAREAFDVNREDPRTRDAYGRGLGEQLLMARRLCESGVGFVTIHFGGWDMHSAVADGMRSLGPQVDRAVSTFIEDLAARGLEQEILLVITGEFGRTPRINPSAGRDHWAPLSTLALAGGGLKMGQVIGESSAHAETPKTTPITPKNLMATVFQVLGIPPELQYVDPTGRPVTLLDGAAPIAELG